MTDEEMYELLCRKAQNIKMHMSAGDVAQIAERFRELCRIAEKNDECGTDRRA